MVAPSMLETPVVSPRTVVAPSRSTGVPHDEQNRPLEETSAPHDEQNIGGRDSTIVSVSQVCRGSKPGRVSLAVS
jgi:hypothetical protein